MTLWRRGELAPGLRMTRGGRHRSDSSSGVVRGRRPDPAERTSAEGGAVPIRGGSSGDGSSQAGSVSDS
jgi:hypothetical protein